jgi:hypothetical protein
VQFIQMWIMPAVRGLEPSVEQRQHTEEDRHNRLLQILRPEGADGATGVTVHQDVSMYVARLDPGVAVEHVFGRGRGGYFYLIEGAVDLNEQAVATGDAAKVTGDGLLRIAARDTSELIFVDTPL